VDPNLPEHFARLPPSLELGDPIIDHPSGHRYAQPRIEYYLRTVVNFTVEGYATPKTMETFLPVIVTPQTDEFPPTETQDFPAEFKEEESHSLRRYVLGPSIGTMKASIREPPAMRFCGHAPGSNTEATLNLQFESESSSNIHQMLHSLTFTIFSLVRVKTFYALEAFPRLPSQTLLGLRGTTRLRDEMIKMKNRTVGDISWSFEYDLNVGTHGIPPVSKLELLRANWRGFS
jgi:hypothetical protein